MTAETAAGALLRNRAAYDALVRVAERCAADNDVERVLRAAAVAADFAYVSPIGVLADPHLESLVITAVRGDEPAPLVERDRRTGRVLHVLTHASGIGGHSRLAWRWMGRDSRVSDLVLTNQSGSAPTELLNAAIASGGQVYDLRSAYDSLADQAHALRELMRDVDVVVAHVHPFDSVMLAAANLPGARPPIILENHADHTYWLGVGAADLICDNREIGQRVSAQLRQVAPERLALLPLSIDPAPKSYSRSDLLEQFTAADDSSVLAICIATPAKLLPVFGTGFTDLADVILGRIPTLCLFVVGPTADGPWQHLADKYPGRVRAVGLLPDADMLYAAADIYLDGYPVSTGTAVLEAAEAGIPVLSLQQTDHYSEVWTAQSPGIGEGIDNLEEYLDQLSELAASTELRRQRGAALQASVRAAHAGEGWRASLEALYARARGAESVESSATPASQRCIGAEYYEELLRYARPGRASFAFDQALPTLPYLQIASDGLYDELMAAWLMAEADRSGSQPRLRVRVQPGWQNARAWALRALKLASREPLVTLSLPPAYADDDANTTLALGLLAQLGLDPENCGQVSIELASSFVDGVVFNVAPDPNGLDRVESIARALRRDWQL
ncbi:hypothetical protein SAMN05444157_3018 [Frankineae bacterium MT45]|nr:hypothetical protein SAMN05444157_3018 [Frankineae bacterium MT45]